MVAAKASAQRAKGTSAGSGVGGGSSFAIGNSNKAPKTTNVGSKVGTGASTSIAPKKNTSLGAKVGTGAYTGVSKTSGGGYSGGSSSSGGGGYSGGAGGGGDVGGGVGGGGVPMSGGDFAAGALAPAPMQEITIPDPLADPTYQRQKAELLRARGDFDAQQALARSQYDNTFNDNMRQMGWRQSVPLQGMRAQIMGAATAPEGWDPTAQGTAYGDSYRGNEGDFAGRGLYNSGLYANSVGNLNNNFNDRRGSALMDQQNWRDTQGLALRNFEGQQNSTDLAAQSDAIAAIAARLGVDIGQVTPGKANTIQRAF